MLVRFDLRGGDEALIRASCIAAIEKDGNDVLVCLDGGHVFNVNHTIEETVYKLGYNWEDRNVVADRNNVGFSASSKGGE